MNTVKRFLDYVSYPTMSDETNPACPSSEKQRALADRLCADLTALGLDAYVDAHGYVYGTLKANCAGDVPTIGLIAHMDTSDECPDAPIRTKTVLHTGEDIILNAEKNLVLSERDYPGMKKYRGKHLIVTDGTTLLGGDDKAGAAEIVSALEELIASGKPHGTVKAAITPDEEIGRGADLFDVSGFGADYAYTVDGGQLGEIEYENFNAASACAEISGRSIHPGAGKGKMINAALVACELNAMLPKEQIPAKTSGYEGFFHLTDMEGSVESARIRYIIRDHDKAKFEEKKALIQAAADTLNKTYGDGTVALTVKDSYYNMKEVMVHHMDVVHAAEEAFRKNGIEPVCVPIRGGTDGARLSFMGLPCPNLPTGSENHHSRFEYACCEAMDTMVQVLVTILTDAAADAAKKEGR